MSHSRWKSAARVAALCGAVGGACTPPAGAELPASEAYGAASDPMPAGAQRIGPEELAGLVKRGEVRLVNAGGRREQRAAADRRRARERETVRERLAGRPEMMERLTRSPSPKDPRTRPTGDGNYYTSVVDSRGRRQTVVTMGEDFVYSELAGSLSGFYEKDNQLALYSMFYASLPARYQSEARLPTPASMREASAAEILRMNLQIAAERERIARQIPRSEPSPAEVSCEAEEGAGSGTDRAGGACARSEGGLHARVDYALKPFATCAKNQGNRGSCAAFAVISAVESSVAALSGRRLNLSEQDLYSKAKLVFQPSEFGDGLTTSDLAEMLPARGYVFPFEESWDYNPSFERVIDEVARTYARSCVGYTGEFCSDTNHQAGLLCADTLGSRFCAFSAPVAGTSGIKVARTAQIWDPGDVDRSMSIVATLLTLRIPVTAAVMATPALTEPDADGFTPFRGPAEPSLSGHAVEVLAVITDDRLPEGVAKGAGGGYFVIKNSWGGCWADAGEGYVPIAWMKSYTLAMLSIVAGT